MIIPKRLKVCAHLEFDNNGHKIVIALIKGKKSARFKEILF